MAPASLLRHSSASTAAGAAAVGSGVLLDVAIAATYGAGSSSDAFFVASRIPLLVQGVLTVVAHQALTPLFSSWASREGHEETDRRISLVLTAGVGSGLAVASIGALAAWWIVRLTAPGLSDNETALAADVARITFFVIPLEVAGDVLEAHLTSRYSMVVPSAAKVVRNLAAGALIVMFVQADTSPAVVAYAYLVGMGGLVITELVMAARRGLHFRPNFALGDPALRETARLCRRPLVGAAINPAARLVELQLLSFLPAGTITIQAYAYRLISAAGGTLFFRSITAAVLPRLSRAWERGDKIAFADLTRRGLRILVAVSIPLTVGVAVLAPPLTRFVFERGAFTAEDAELLGWVLVAYSFSLVGSAAQRGLLAPFYASLDTRTPLRNTLYGNIANIVILAVLLIRATPEPSTVILVGVAFSIAQYVHVAHAWWCLDHELHIPLRRPSTQAVPA